ncbi:MAG: bifunctional diguanylate cyclase/phosphodiesterase [Lysobacterales bacterium]|jgi:diguanylate cyclase (GGDEF)-like protein|nr:MAG: bifunctional diguanylate cyclase/phosphodiesterase [Xanthomonadales bacterium]
MAGAPGEVLPTQVGASSPFPLEVLRAKTLSQAFAMLRAWARDAFGVRIELVAEGSVLPGLSDEGPPRLGEASPSPALDVELGSSGLRLVLHGERAASAGLALEPYRQLLGDSLARLSELERLQHQVAELERAKRLQEALYEIADLASGGAEMDDVFARLHEVVGRLMYAENFYIALYDRSSRSIRFPYFRDSVDPEPIPPDRIFGFEELEGWLTRHIIETGQTLMGTGEEIRRQLGPSFTPVGAPSEDWLGVPLKIGEEIIGAVVVQSYEPSKRFSAEDRSLLTFVAQHIATALQRRFAHAELERRVAERTEALREVNRALEHEVQERRRGERLQSALYRIARLAFTSDSLDAFFRQIHEIVSGLLYARNLYIALLSEDGTSIDFPYSADEYDRERRSRKLGRGMTEYVLRTGKPLLADQEVSHRLEEAGEVVSIGTESVHWLGVPLMSEDRTIGVLAVQSYSEEYHYSQADLELLTFVGYQIAHALERKRADEALRAANRELERRVEERTAELAEANARLREEIVQRQHIEARLMHDALHDALTGLPNRAYLLDRLSHALERVRGGTEPSFAILFLDLDRFKVINDSLGHLLGDELLKQVAARLRRVTAGQGWMARLGGDEFAILIDPLSRPDEAERLAERVLETLNAPFHVSGKELYTSASVGIAIGGSHYTRPEELLRDADVALYRAKSAGRRRWQRFDEALHREAMRVVQLESELRRGLARGEFEPWFQPIVALADGRVVGYEALMRWRHPERGLVGPGDFLTVAEDTGLIETLDWRMLAEACSAFRAHGMDEETFLSVNVSAQHFRSPNFGERLLELLRAMDFPPGRLRVEVTESSLIEEPAHARASLFHLSEAGVRVALDDFGTGYSSLGYLHRFPLHALKIDRSFIQGLDQEASDSGRAVVQAVIMMAKALDLEVVAEGVETPRQRKALAELGCDFAQGFLFGRAGPLDRLSSDALAGERASGG